MMQHCGDILTSYGGRGVGGACHYRYCVLREMGGAVFFGVSAYVSLGNRAPIAGYRRVYLTDYPWMFRCIFFDR